VEYKRGHPKEHRADEIQLCAQAFCLEEMLAVAINQGALFYGQTRRRVDVLCDLDLRRLTRETANGTHEMMQANMTPPPVYGKWCESCSLFEDCQPKLLDNRRSAQEWLQRQMERTLS